MTKLTVAATQMECVGDHNKNVANAEAMVRKAAAQGAQVILIQELFESPYFCIEQAAKHFQLASSLEDNTTIKKMAALAKELNVVLPVSWFEKAGAAFFNSVAMIDADGTVMGVYRKTHIPNSIGYQEKTYFSPGDSGFKVWQTKHARIGLGICWDQWFPETARCLALLGAELLLFPSAIGSEPGDASFDSKDHWQNVMCGHAAANIMPLVASNRIGKETATTNDIHVTFYGSSFISDHHGNKVATASRTDEDILVHTFDLDGIRFERETWGVFRDRRPETYAPIHTLDGNSSSATAKM